MFGISNKRLLKVSQASPGGRPGGPLSATLDLFGNPLTPPLLVRLDRQVKPCCDNVAIVGPGKAQHAAELRCVGCGGFRGWLSHFDFNWLTAIAAKNGVTDKPIVLRNWNTATNGDDQMAKQYDNSNTGAIFKNTEKESDNHPDYRGSLNVAGAEFWISGWLKISKKGLKFMSLAVKPKEKSSSAKPKSSLADDLNDEVPW